MVRGGYSGYKNLEASSYAIEKDKKFKIIYEKNSIYCKDTSGNVDTGHMQVYSFPRGRLKRYKRIRDIAAPVRGPITCKKDHTDAIDVVLGNGWLRAVRMDGIRFLSSVLQLMRLIKHCPLLLPEKWGHHGTSTPVIWSFVITACSANTITVLTEVTGPEPPRSSAGKTPTSH